MVKVQKHGVILEPTRLDFENQSVFNPGIWQEGNTVHVIYRALNKNHVSCLGYARLAGPTKVVERWQEPFKCPRHKYDKMGVEDPRIVKINNKFYLTYTAHDGQNAVVAYSYGEDLFKLRDGGIISPQFSYDVAAKYFDDRKLKDKYFFFKSYYKDTVARSVKLWDKDAFFWPEKINGRFALAHRILPDMQLVYCDNLKQLKDQNFWKNYLRRLSNFVVLESKYGFEGRNVGGGCPPIKTRHGWLLIYHAVEPLNKGRIYHAGAALVSLSDPTREIARLPHPLFSPVKRWEKKGLIHNVVFPTGTAMFGDRLYIYYGTADTSIAVASVNLGSLVKELLKYKK
ncbi:MAG: pesticidal protein Cry7Aa [Patescibacteria group bacterium]